MWIMIKRHLSSIFLGTSLLIVSVLSLFIGVMEIDWKALFSGGSGMELRIFLLAVALVIALVISRYIGNTVSHHEDHKSE